MRLINYSIYFAHLILWRTCCTQWTPLFNCTTFRNNPKLVLFISDEPIVWYYSWLTICRGKKTLQTHYCSYIETLLIKTYFVIFVCFLLHSTCILPTYRNVIVTYIYAYLSSDYINDINCDKCASNCYTYYISTFSRKYLHFPHIFSEIGRVF